MKEIDVDVHSIVLYGLYKLACGLTNIFQCFVQFIFKTFRTKVQHNIFMMEIIVGSLILIDYYIMVEMIYIYLETIITSL